MGGAAAAAGVEPPPAVVGVSIDALDAVEAAELAGRVVGGTLEGSSNGSDDDGDDDPYTDARPRAVRLVGEGAVAGARVAAIAAAVKAGAGGPGLALVEM